VRDKEKTKEISPHTSTPRLTISVCLMVRIYIYLCTIRFRNTSTTQQGCANAFSLLSFKMRPRELSTRASESKSDWER